MKKADQDIRLFDWGNSMYGGYYANYFDNDRGVIVGIHSDTLRELREQLREIGLKTETAKRFDN